MRIDYVNTAETVTARLLGNKLLKRISIGSKACDAVAQSIEGDAIHRRHANLTHHAQGLLCSALRDKQDVVCLQENVALFAGHDLAQVDGNILAGCAIRIAPDDQAVVRPGNRGETLRESDRLQRAYRGAAVLLDKAARFGHSADHIDHVGCGHVDDITIAYLDVDTRIFAAHQLPELKSLRRLRCARVRLSGNQSNSVARRRKQSCLGNGLNYRGTLLEWIESRFGDCSNHGYRLAAVFLDKYVHRRIAIEFRIFERFAQFVGKLRWGQAGGL